MEGPQPALSTGRAASGARSHREAAAWIPVARFTQRAVEAERTQRQSLAPASTGSVTFPKSISLSEFVLLPGCCEEETETPLEMAAPGLQGDRSAGQEARVLNP